MQIIMYDMIKRAKEVHGYLPSDFAPRQIF